MIDDAKVYVNGFRIEDKIQLLSDFSKSTFGSMIFVMGWEERAIHLLRSGKVGGEVCYLTEFEESSVSDSTRGEFLKLAGELFSETKLIELGSLKCADAVMTATEQLVSDIKSKDGVDCAVDYSSMPRVVSQTLFRRFMIEGARAKVVWFYVSGAYDQTGLPEHGSMDSGAKEFFTIRGADGLGGMSSKKIALLGLGADRALAAAFLRADNYDTTHLLYASSRHSPKLMAKVLEQKYWLQAEYGMTEDDFEGCDSASVADALRGFRKILSDYPEDSGVAVDLFCCGPKTQTIAAAIVADAHKNVRLVGRVTGEYKKLDVPPTNELSTTVVLDFTNPRIVDSLI